MPDNYRVNNDFIIYIGETTGQTLAERLRQFNTSAFSERPGHSGGNTFRMTLLETIPLEQLWVSACPVDMGTPTLQLTLSISSANCFGSMCALGVDILNAIALNQRALVEWSTGAPCFAGIGSMWSTASSCQQGLGLKTSKARDP
jgi:hypothetical protein